MLRDVSHEIRSPLARLRLRMEFIDSSTHFALTVPDGKVMVNGNERLLQRCLSNLLCHSLAYSTLSPGSSKICVRYDGDHAQFALANAAAQLYAAVVSRLFEPFFRPDASRTRDTDGHGLGLTLSH